MAESRASHPAIGTGHNPTSDDAIRETTTSDHSERLTVQPVTFRDHNGVPYIWPFDMCRSFESIQPLLQEIYERMKDDWHLNIIRSGNYNIVTVDNFVILPAVWTSIIKPGIVIEILFPSSGRRRQASDSRSISSRRGRRDSDEWYHENYPQRRRNIRIVAPVATVDVETSQESQSEDDEDSSDSSEQSDDQIPEPPTPQPMRMIVPALDAAGNALSFAINTARPSKQLLAAKQRTEESAPRISTSSTQEIRPEALRITKAIMVEEENKSMIELHTLTGPETSRTLDAVSIKWYHITDERLDFNRFRATCLALPSVSDRRQSLMKALLARVEKENVKVFLDGMFVEPGTVARVDEQGQSDPESAIFSCVPYFDIGLPPKRNSSIAKDRLFPPRTLMQSFYPYEPVRDRDEEQAYRKFGDDHLGRLIYVPNIWMVNIASDMVITYSHRALTELMIKSLSIIQEPVQPKSADLVRSNGLLSASQPEIKLTNVDGRTFVLPFETCRSFFQLEQKILELKCASSCDEKAKGVKIELDCGNTRKQIFPHNWHDIVGKRHEMAVIVITSLSTEEQKQRKDVGSTHDSDSSVITGAVQPIFSWPIKKGSWHNPQDDKAGESVSSTVKRPLEYLEKVEKNILTQTLMQHQTWTAVDRTFTSTAFYQSLNEETWEYVQGSAPVSANLEPLKATPAKPASLHQRTVQSQCFELHKQWGNFLDAVHTTLKLFVEDVDKSTMLRKVWGAMASIQHKVATIEKRGAVEFRSSRERAWFIRNAKNEEFDPIPENDKPIKRTFKRCRKCKNAKPYYSIEAARKHLEDHEKLASRLNRDSSDTVPVEPIPMTSDHQDWIVSYSQRRIEEANIGATLLLKKAAIISCDLRNDVRDLIEGVRNEDGSMSKLYSLPPRILEAFREILIFYFAVERALHFNEESYENDDPLKDRYDEDPLPYSEISVLQRFADDARRSLRIARHQLCYMVKSDTPLNMGQMSLGPEYVCAWLMRRLIVMPLSRRLTIGDMYREYLSTIQFQVNHRPGKRLLRDINLLQEELNVLLEVNSWQKTLIEDYMHVLDDTSYECESLSRKAMFGYEQVLLQSCLDDLQLVSEDYADLIRRCGPLGNKTKQSLEINEEDHGKAIMVFTVVTVVFLPLSFVTSYLGMNTTDIRDMGSNQSLFYVIALPLTFVTVGICVLIGYNGDELRDFASSMYRKLTGKEDRALSARGISVAQRKRAQRIADDASASFDFGSLADEAEFVNPQSQRGYQIIEYDGKDITQDFENPYQPQAYVDYMEPASVPRPSYNRVGRRIQAAALPDDSRVADRADDRRPLVHISKPLIEQTGDIYSSSKPRTRHYNNYENVHVPRYSSRADGVPSIIKYPIPPPIIRPASIYSEEGQDGGYVWLRKRSRTTQRPHEHTRYS